MRLQLAKCLGCFPLAITQDLLHRDLGVVVQNGSWYARKIGEGLIVALQERLRILRRKRHHETVVGLRQVHAQEMTLLLDPANHHHRLAEIHLGIAGRMHQRDKHLLVL